MLNVALRRATRELIPWIQIIVARALPAENTLIIHGGPSGPAYLIRGALLRCVEIQ